MPTLNFTTGSLRALCAPERLADGRVAQVDYFDKTTPGLFLRISSTGVRTWMYFARVVRKGRRVGAKFTIGRGGDSGLGVADARERARALKASIDRGEDPKAMAEREARARQDYGAATFDAIADKFIERYAKKKNRSWQETERLLKRHVRPKWGDWPIGDIRRPHVTELLDEIEDRSGPATANRALAAVRKMFNWHAARTDDFNSPIVIGMARAEPAPRDRLLSDDECRRLWLGLDEARVSPTYRDGLRMLFLTAQRRGEVFGMRWVHLQPDSEGGALWTIPAEIYKTKRAQIVYLTPMAFDIVQRQPRRNSSDLVFSTDGKSVYDGFGKANRELSRVADVSDWRIHDIRRTCRSALAEMGVAHEVAERVLGHVVGRIEATYNRHSYLAEKRAAMLLLEQRATWIVNANENSIVRKAM